MKINKIIAAGAAATLAVTSLASVASAKAPREWPLKYNFGKLTATPVAYKASGKAHGTVAQDQTIFGTNQVRSNVAATKGGITEAYVLDVQNNGGTAGRAAADAEADGLKGTLPRADTNGSAGRTVAQGPDVVNRATRVDDDDFDAIIPMFIKANTDATWDGKLFTAYAKALKVTVEGSKRDNTGFTSLTTSTSIYDGVDQIWANGAAVNLTGELDDNDDPAAYGHGDVWFEAAADEELVILPLWYTTAPKGMLMPFEFDKVDYITIDTSGMSGLAWVTQDKNTYFKLADLIDAGTPDYLNYIANANETDDLVPAQLETAWYYDPDKADLKDINNFAAKGVRGRVEVTFEIPELYEHTDDGFLTYRSGIQLTEDCRIDTQNGNAVVLEGEQFVSGRLNDPTRGGQPAAPTGDVDQATNAPTAIPKDAVGVGNLLVEEIAREIHGTYVIWRITKAELGESNAWLPYTDIYEVPGTLYRREIWKLSDTEDYNSTTLDTWGAVVSNVSGADRNQTYEVTDYRVGTQPLGFAGLASQVADYFNKELSGTITFTFVDPSDLNGRQWLTGGIPSTEVGLKNALSGANANDFVLYLNYGSTTGSLETVTNIDVDAGEVTFDISKILDDMGGYTKATVHDIYYGMTKYTTYINANTRGMWVSKVTLRTDGASDVGGDVTVEDDDVTVEDDDDVTVEDDDDDVTIDDDDDDDDVTVEDDDDVTIEDDDDVTIEDDDDVAIEDDDDAEGEVEIVGGDDDDANPHTGVALAVVPAIVAAAAIVVSKKRK